MTYCGVDLKDPRTQRRTPSPGCGTLGRAVLDTDPPSLESCKARARRSILASSALPRGRAMAQIIKKFFIVMKYT